MLYINGHSTYYSKEKKKYLKNNPYIRSPGQLFF